MRTRRAPSNRIRRSITGLLAATLFLSGLGCAAATVTEWRDDIESIANRLNASHPDPYARCGRLSFRRAVEDLKSRVPELSEEARMVGLMRLVAMVGDTHTQLEPNRPDFALWYPIRLYEFRDGYFVTAAHKSAQELAGAQVLEIAGKPAAQVVDDARSLMGSDNAFSAKEGLFAISDAALMKGMGYADAQGRLTAKFRLGTGAVVERSLSAQPTSDPLFDKDDSTFEWHFRAEMGGPPIGDINQWISAFHGLPYAAFRTTDEARPLRLMNRRIFASKALPDHDAFYIQSNFVDGTFDTRFHDALKEVDRVHPRRLIVDLRYNFGGDGSRVPAVAREFISRAEHPPWKELYVLTGPRTLSAGIMAVQAIVGNVDASIIGEPMAAPLNSFGDPREFTFPKTGTRLTVSTVFHQLGDPHDISMSSRVDYPADLSFKEYSVGADPLADPVIEGRERRSIATIALSDGGVKARSAFEQRRQEASRYAWWRPPSEPDLRAVTQRLAAENRLADAVVIGGLNTELHPDIWNAWYNLGVVQKALGARSEALSSWRHVLELDPLNPNRDEIRSLAKELDVRVE